MSTNHGGAKRINERCQSAAFLPPKAAPRCGDVEPHKKEAICLSPTFPPCPRDFLHQPPDPVFPSLEDADEKLVRELVEGKRSRSQAQRVLQELSSACKEASIELEVLLQVR